MRQPTASKGKAGKMRKLQLFVESWLQMFVDMLQADKGETRREPQKLEPKLLNTDDDAD